MLLVPDRLFGFLEKSTSGFLRVYKLFVINFKTLSLIDRNHIVF